MADSSVLRQLMQTIQDRKANPPERSYTTHLLEGGAPRIGEKITEEAAEVVQAAEEALDPNATEGHQHLVHEAADLIYHLFVMLGLCEVELAEVEAELAKRFGTSGLDEKAARE